jgi:hypothetical protein
MAAGPSVTWTHCSVCYKVTSGINRRVRADGQYPRHGCQGIWRDYIRGLQTFHSHFLHRLGLEVGEAMVCLVHFVVWVAIGGSLFVQTCRCCANQFFSTQPFEDYFKVVAAQITMTRTPASDWTPWYVDLQTGRVQCLICGEDFTKKNSRMLSHLRYIPSIGARDSNVKLCKNVKPNMLHA